MLDADELVELRALQSRAYGRSGELSDADARRLALLESARLAAVPDEPVVAPRPAAASLSEHPPLPSRGAGRPVGDAVVAADVEADTTGAIPTADASVPALVRRHWRALVAILVAAVAVGVLAGWALFGQRAVPGIELNAEQQAWHGDLVADERFDPGSVRPIAEKGGVIAWYATRESGEQVCAVLGDGDTVRTACGTHARAQDEGVHGTLSREVDGVTTEVAVMLMLGPDGSPAALMSSYIIDDGSVQWNRYASEDEERVAEQLSERGYDPQSIWVLGYDGDVPLWGAVDATSGMQCLIYDGSDAADPTVCDDAEYLWNDGGALTLSRGDQDSGSLTTYVYRLGMGAQVLEITRDADARAE